VPTFIMRSLSTYQEQPVRGLDAASLRFSLRFSWSLCASVIDQPSTRIVELDRSSLEYRGWAKIRQWQSLTAATRSAVEHARLDECSPPPRKCLADPASSRLSHDAARRHAETFMIAVERLGEIQPDSERHS